MSTSLINSLLLASTAIYLGAAVAFLIGLRRKNRPARSRSRPFVSVVIAARNEADYIADCLAGLVNQTYPADRYEVLVVDDGSTDPTPLISAGYSARHSRVRNIEVTDAFQHMAAKKRPLSEGIRAARGSIILTTDADCAVPNTWVAGMVSQLEAGAEVVIGFSQVKTGQDRLMPAERLQAFDFLALMSASAGAANLGMPLAATGQNLGYRKALFERVDGFEKIAHCPSGDDVLLLQLFPAGRRDGRICRPPGHICQHPARGIHGRFLGPAAPMGVERPTRLDAPSPVFRLSRECLSAQPFDTCSRGPGCGRESLRPRAGLFRGQNPGGPLRGMEGRPPVRPDRPPACAAGMGNRADSLHGSGGVVRIVRQFRLEGKGPQPA